jgi:hypothetical protein
MSDVIAVSKPVKGSNECSAIVCDNFGNGSPSIQDIFEYEYCKGTSGLDTEGMPLGPGEERASCLHNVMETRSRQH